MIATVQKELSCHDHDCDPSDRTRISIGEEGICHEVLNDSGIADCTPAARRRAAMSRASACRSLLLCSVLIAGLWCLSGFSPKVRPAPERQSAGKAAAVQVVDLDLRSLPGVAHREAGQDSVAWLRPRSSDDAGNSLVEPTRLQRSAGAHDSSVAAAKAASGVTVDLNVAGHRFHRGDAGRRRRRGRRWALRADGERAGRIGLCRLRHRGRRSAGRTGQALDALWQGAGACAEGWGHPNVVHDALADRWVLSELGAGNHLCVYVSQTADPVSGGWYAYDFELPKFPDFARIGVWVGRVLRGHQRGPAGRLRSRTLGHARRRCGRLAAFHGAGARRVRFPGPRAGRPRRRQISPPAGPAACSCATSTARRTAGRDRLELFELDVNWGSPGSSSLSGPVALATAPFDSSLCGYCGPRVRAAAGKRRHARSRCARSSCGPLRYRRFATHESLVGNFAVDTDGVESCRHPVVRAAEERRLVVAPPGGDLQPRRRHRWIGSAAMDGDGNLALVFNVADGSATYPSIRVTGTGSGRFAGRHDRGRDRDPGRDQRPDRGPLARAVGRVDVAVGGPGRRLHLLGDRGLCRRRRLEHPHRVVPLSVVRHRGQPT